MNLVLISAGDGFYLASEDTGEKVENFLVQQYQVNHSGHVMYHMGSPDGVPYNGRIDAKLEGVFTNYSHVVHKEKIYVIAKNYRDFKTYCDFHGIRPSKENGFGEVVEITQPNDLRGCRVRKYYVTPSAIFNEYFNDTIEVLKGCVK